MASTRRSLHSFTRDSSRGLALHGQFTWDELTTPDVDAAKRFYPRFTGWGTQPFDNDYAMRTSGAVPVAGLCQLRDEIRETSLTTSPPPPERTCRR